MKTFNNVDFPEDGKKTLDPEGNPFKNYFAVMLFAVLQPDHETHPRGFSPKESYDLYKFVDKMEKLKDKKEINLEDADFEKLKKAFNRLRSGASREMADMYKYIQTVK